MLACQQLLQKILLFTLTHSFFLFSFTLLAHISLLRSINLAQNTQKNSLISLKQHLYHCFTFSLNHVVTTLRSHFFAIFFTISHLKTHKNSSPDYFSHLWTHIYLFFQLLVAKNTEFLPRTYLNTCYFLRSLSNKLYFNTLTSLFLVKKKFSGRRKNVLLGGCHVLPKNSIVLQGSPSQILTALNAA